MRHSALNLLAELGRGGGKGTLSFPPQSIKIFSLFMKAWCSFSSTSSENLSRKRGWKKGISHFSGTTDSFLGASEQW